MKTEPTEALKSLIREVYDVYESDGQDIENIVNYEEAEKAVRSAFEEGQSNPKIKQLDQLGWLEQSNGLIYTPHVFGITYCIYEEKGMWWIHCQFYNNYENISTDFAATLDEAKAAAQADFEKRVMECLDIE